MLYSPLFVVFPQSSASFPRKEVAEKAKAYLKINTRISEEKAIRDNLKAISVVKSADITTGKQDTIAVVEAEKIEDLIRLVAEEVRKIDGVEKTVTHFVLE